MELVLNILKWFGLALLGLFAIFVVGLVLVPPLTRGLTDKWGATPAEVSASYPGDELIDAKREVSTKAVTIDAPPDLVYSLLVQMGQHRAGWYGWDWFYDLTKSSDFVDGHYSTRVVPELQSVKAGDTISINDMVQYTVISAERPKNLVLYVGTGEAGRAGGSVVVGEHDGVRDRAAAQQPLAPHPADARRRHRDRLLEVDLERPDELRRSAVLAQDHRGSEARRREPRRRADGREVGAQRGRGGVARQPRESPPRLHSRGKRASQSGGILRSRTETTSPPFLLRKKTR